jgi:hypothetical protein
VVWQDVLDLQHVVLGTTGTVHESATWYVSRPGIYND